MIVRELVTKLGFDLDTDDIKNYEGFIKKVKNEADKASGSMLQMSRAARDAGKSLSLFVTAPIVGLGVVAVKSASDAEEAVSKFNVVFQDVSKTANTVADELGVAFGLGETKARELLGTTGDLLTGFGFTQDSALDLSTQVQELAVDLASFTNFSGGAEGASEALTKALLGEREMVKSLGISILEEDVKRQVQINSANGMTFASMRQAKALATLQIAQRQSKNAIGDFARTSNNFAAQTRLLTIELRELAIEFGEILLPFANKLVKGLRALIERIREMSKFTKVLIIGFLAFAAILGPVLFIVGQLGIAVFGLQAVFKGLALAVGLSNKALALLILKIIAIPALLIAIGVAAFLISDDILGFFQGKDSVLGNILGEFGIFRDDVLEVWEAIKDGIEFVLQPVFWLIFNITKLIKSIPAAFNKAKNFVKSSASDFFKSNTPLAIVARSSARLGQSLLGSGNNGAGGTVNNNVNVTTEVTVPEGSTEEQKKAMQDQVKQIMNDRMQSILQQSTNEHPVFG